MTKSIITKDVAKMIRAQLKSAFPGVKFSVRCGTGTGSAWIGVHYDDGPTYDQVAAIARAFEGRTFNGMTDGYDENESGLIASEGDNLPQEVQYQCDGVNIHRSFTPTAHLEAERIIATDSNVRDLMICDDAGKLVQGNLNGPTDDLAVIGGRVQRHPYLDAHMAVHLALSERDLTPVRCK
ncbi:LPD29 domain-containing protein [Herbiconiux sp. YIM B11900]|uniref:LPD29 domain-containing protein n=1 Tax=Herbiconiux sp. YIM B11900 TaxID=3404131 RepID=UPI003F85626C